MTPTRRRSALCLVVAAIALLSGCEWLSYHGGGSRSGVLPAYSGPRSMRAAWSHQLDGAVYASPIVHAGTVYVATEGGSVYAFSSSGALRWRTHIANPVRLSDLAARGASCGNIDPLGITGTPVFDPRTGRLFVVAETLVNGAVRHQLVALNGRTGAVFARRTVTPPRGNPAAHQQRGALALSLSRVLVTFGGLAGDCGNYIGSVVSTRTDLAGPQLSYAIPTTREAGIWTPPGPTVLSDGSILVTSGNGESRGRYDGSDSVVRLSPALKLLDRFSPTTWPSDNAGDLDLGSMGPAVTSNGFVVQSGKRGITYVLRLSRLSGPGGTSGSAARSAAPAAALPTAARPSPGQRFSCPAATECGAPTSARTAASASAGRPRPGSPDPR